MDFRYESNEAKKEFDKKRKAFIIINKKLELLPEGLPLSHYDYCKSRKIDEKIFNTLIRGFYYNGRVVIYKDSFIYDNELIIEAIKYLDELSKKIGIEEFEIYFGQQPDKEFAPMLFYGKYKNGEILKNK